MLFPKSSLAVLTATLLLAACGGDSDDDRSPVTQDAPPQGSDQDQDQGQDQDGASTQTGVFVDSPVAGVSYTTSPGGKEGVTNSAGEYDYEEGDTVQFSIGGIDFPVVSAKGKVTPLDMGDEGADLSSPKVRNIVRLLQTLDEDGDPENGITISEQTSNALADSVLEFDEATFESEASAIVNAQLSKQLVSEEEAMAHFESSLAAELLGSWVYEEDNGNVNVLTFFGDKRYVMVHSKADDGDQTAGSGEYGRYEWDPVTGDFAIELIRESDKSGGLYDATEPEASQGFAVTVDGSSLSLDFGEGSIDFDQVQSSADNLVGAWYLAEAENTEDAGGGVLLTFLTDSDYVLVHTWNTEAYPGEQLMRVTSEWNSYEWSDSGDFSVDIPSVETDGPGGLFNEEGNEDVDSPKMLPPRHNGDLIYQFNPDESVSFAAIGSFVARLQDFSGDTSSAPIKRVHGRFQEGVSTAFELGIPVSGAEGTYEGEIGETAVVTLNADGSSGSMIFDDASENTISEWSVSTSGVLTFKEYDGDPADAATWTLTPIASKSGDAVLVQQSDLGLSYLGRAKAHSPE